MTGQIKSIDDLEPGDWRRQNPRFQGDNFQRNLDLVRGVEQIAQDKKCTPAQLCLAWLLSRGNDIVPIPGTRSIRRLEENAAAVEVLLSFRETERIEELFPNGAALGSRYPEGGMRSVNR